MTTETCRQSFADSRIARFATVTPDGAPHLVPVTCALGTIDGRETIVFAIDHKPKTTTALRRLANIAAEPRASFLVDAYSEDWTELWWVRADVTATVIDTRFTLAESAVAESAVAESAVAEGAVAESAVAEGAVAESPAIQSFGAEIRSAAIDLLVDKYPQYRAHRPAGAVVLATVTRWSGWSAGTVTPRVG